MKRAIECFLVAWCVAALPAFGQQTNQSSDRSACKVYFSVVLLDQDVPGGFSLGMDEQQSRWYQKQAVKEHLGICYVADPRDARVQYLLAYSAGMQQNPPLNHLLGYPEDQPTGGGFVGGLAEGYTRESVLMEGRLHKAAYLSVWHLTTDASGKHALDPQVAIYATKHVSRNGLLTRALSHPSRAVLEDGVRFLASLTR
jgi:hypothetical protein